MAIFFAVLNIFVGQRGVRKSSVRKNDVFAGFVDSFLCDSFLCDSFLCDIVVIAIKTAAGFAAHPAGGQPRTKAEAATLINDRVYRRGVEPTRFFFQ